MLWAPCRRAIAAVFAAWSFVVQEEPAALHACAMHDGVAHAVGPASAAASHAASSDAPAHHVASTPDAAARHNSDGHHSRGCTCPGPCCDASPVATIATGISLAVPAARPTARFAVRHTTYVPSDPEHSRPPSVGPPAPHIG